MRYLTLTLLISLQTHAEYRVFKLRITTTPKTLAKAAPPAAPDQKPAEPSKEESAQERFIISNLDPEQYVGYYPIAENEKVEYVQTWMCRGRTGDFKSFCPAPDDAQALPTTAEAPLDSSPK